MTTPGHDLDRYLGGYVPITHQFELRLPAEVMAPPREWIDLPKTGLTSDAVNKNYVDKHRNAAMNIAQLHALQSRRTRRHTENGLPFLLCVRQGALSRREGPTEIIRSSWRLS